MSPIAPEFEFILPMSYLDEDGRLHWTGVMRLATARDELVVLRDHSLRGPEDPRLTILVLARVIVSLGTMETVPPDVIEKLFASDLAYLQEFYAMINFGEEEDVVALTSLAFDAYLSCCQDCGRHEGAS